MPQTYQTIAVCVFYVRKKDKTFIGNILAESTQYLLSQRERDIISIVPVGGWLDGPSRVHFHQ